MDCCDGEANEANVEVEGEPKGAPQPATSRDGETAEEMPIPTPEKPKRRNSLMVQMN